MPLFDALKNMAVRYIQHFSPYFLFMKYDPNPFIALPIIGYFYWYTAPLMLAGLLWLLWRFKSSYSARLLLAFVIAYPVGDCLVWGHELSVLRSSPGVCALSFYLPSAPLILLAGYGTKTEMPRLLWWQFFP